MVVLLILRRIRHAFVVKFGQQGSYFFAIFLMRLMENNLLVISASNPVSMTMNEENSASVHYLARLSVPRYEMGTTINESN